MFKKVLFFFFLFRILGFHAQERLNTQYSPFLAKTYYNFNFGAVFNNFSNENLAPGFDTATFRKNRFSGRFLLGYKLNPKLGLQFGVLRPASWFSYENINNIGYKRTVWMNIWSLSLKQELSLSKKYSIYGELGIANESRVGFAIDNQSIYDDAHFANLIAGVGVSYRLSDTWSFLVNTTYLPKSTKYNQPAIVQASVGLNYNMQQIPKEKAILYKLDQTYFFPKQLIQVSYGTSALGFLPNRFFSMNLTVGNSKSIGIPIFWLGESKARHTFGVNYQRTAFRTQKSFSLDWGAGLTVFETQATREKVVALSVYPVLRFYVWRHPKFDMYTNYSIIGPTFISKKNIDHLETGPHLTYQDFMGIGAFVGKTRRLNLELKIMHYSNGNIFPENAGVAIPVLLTLGKTF